MSRRACGAYIAAALASAGTASAESATLGVLVDKDAAVVEAAVRSLIGQIPSLSAAQKRAWTDHILQLADRKKNKTALPPVSEAAVVRLLAALDDPARGRRCGIALCRRLRRKCGPRPCKRSASGRKRRIKSN